ncbi:hypothetical protein [Paractinoplanes toevensis]|uniref:Uncharacterized protein n=1 Tax=Paractinoplanes toevensis TaxID=571911 RepID=A0A919T4C1_9ACTN|nr:hypothetical protein [Actinoplanes toevensis]GIM88800.1 hypothetical protein Ato02nite_005930 [Actinoplanes toevensis]
MDLLDSPTAEVAARLDWAKEQIGLLHLNAVIDLLVASGWCVEDAREAAVHTLAASYLVAAENEGDS